MRRKRGLLLTLLFIIVNFILIYIDNDQQVDRISYVNEWNRTQTMDIRENLIQDGILIPTEEEHIYFNQQQGNFQSFMVEKGDAVDVGDPLYTYAVTDYNQTYRTLTHDIERLQDEIDALETIINEIENYEIPEQEDSIQVSLNDGEDELNIPVEGQLETEYQIQQFLFEKEAERTQKEAQLSSLENQLSDLEQTGDTITVESPIAGIVNHRSESLNDPLMTISSQELQAYGELTEQQRQIVKESMTVRIETNTELDTLPGTIANIGDVPEAGDLKRESSYPITVTFNEAYKNELLKPGYHVGLDITLKESLDAVAANQNQITDHNIWKMTDEGKLELTDVTTGLEEDQWVEITEGAEAGDSIAYGPANRLRHETPFITPLDAEMLAWYMIQPENIEWKEYLLMGLLVR
ncbi:efflux RND transporter periplasmic adaptor subunit [Tenuibacillus multivorans]|uniref:HlyD family secretion protein n=1 Tax=Tenuibacillus multivorans TaxID=237069 RepID=A0A1H0BSD6_9BACI|nr:HlyD family efflux transporter periplasmic adaptor subunit [Tenuibacillus multivorans]GEL77051.1 RND transporter MFP subunit [Tenuibacillus multivorans]SDN48574.1 HlyD family secretion protein [Tenuibacillus multivorans]